MQGSAFMFVRSLSIQNLQERECELMRRCMRVGSQACTHNVQLPVAVQLDNGTGFLEGTYTAPIVPNSSLPALLGLEACHRERAIIDCLNNKLYLAGDGDFDLLKALPPGTKVISLETAPSGHMMIPCADFAGLGKFQNRGGWNSLITLISPKTRDFGLI